MSFDPHLLPGKKDEVISRLKKHHKLYWSKLVFLYGTEKEAGKAYLSIRNATIRKAISFLKKFNYEVKKK